MEPTVSTGAHSPRFATGQLDNRNGLTKGQMKTLVSTTSAIPQKLTSRQQAAIVHAEGDMLQGIIKLIPRGRRKKAMALVNQLEQASRALMACSSSKSNSRYAGWPFRPQLN